MEELIVPYTVGTETGYGINWGKWLWKNKKLFEQHHLDVDFSELGVLRSYQIRYRLFKSRALYQKDTMITHKIFKLVYRVINKTTRILKSI